MKFQKISILWAQKGYSLGIGGLGTKKIKDIYKVSLEFLEGLGGGSEEKSLLWGRFLILSETKHWNKSIILLLKKLHYTVPENIHTHSSTD